MNPLPNETTTYNFTISWNGTDTIGEIDFYTIFASVNAGPFNAIINRTNATNATFPGEQGGTYKFICIATDTAGNIEVQPPQAEASTTLPLPTISIIGTPSIGTNITVTLSDPFRPYSPYLAALSLGTQPGIPLGDGRTIPLNLDLLLLLSIDPAYWPVLGLNNFQGFLNQNGQATASWNIPNVPAAAGLTVYAAFVTINPLLPGVQAVTSISNAVPITFLP